MKTTIGAVVSDVVFRGCQRLCYTLTFKDRERPEPHLNIQLVPRGKHFQSLL